VQSKSACDVAADDFVIARRDPSDYRTADRGAVDFALCEWTRTRGTLLASRRSQTQPIMKGSKETIGSVLCLIVILGVLVTMDPRVRMKAGAIVSDPIGGAVTPWGDRVTDLGGTLLGALKDQSIDNAPFLIFAVVGGLLFLFMLKT
jgi:hypothetical protein